MTPRSGAPLRAEALTAPAPRNVLRCSQAPSMFRRRVRSLSRTALRAHTAPSVRYVTHCLVQLCSRHHHTQNRVVGCIFEGYKGCLRSQRTSTAPGGQPCAGGRPAEPLAADENMLPLRARNGRSTSALLLRASAAPPGLCVGAVAVAQRVSTEEAESSIAHGIVALFGVHVLLVPVLRMGPAAGADRHAAMRSASSRAKRCAVSSSFRATATCRQQCRGRWALLWRRLTRAATLPVCRNA